MPECSHILLPLLLLNLLKLDKKDSLDQWKKHLKISKGFLETL
jgi:hypothetical protein